jgi:hypothetical protein
MSGKNGKGSARRPGKPGAYARGFERIQWNKKRGGNDKKTMPVSSARGAKASSCALITRAAASTQSVV